jgi:hypothetical protein
MCVRICFLFHHTKKIIEIITFLPTKMAAKFWLTEGSSCAVLSFQSYVVQKATRTQFKLKDVAMRTLFKELVRA